MMQVNAFWFGFLIGAISICVLAVVVAYFHKPDDMDVEPVTIEELKEILKEVRDEEENEDDQ